MHKTQATLLMVVLMAAACTDASRGGEDAGTDGGVADGAITDDAMDAAGSNTGDASEDGATPDGGDASSNTGQASEDGATMDGGDASSNTGQASGDGATSDVPDAAPNTGDASEDGATSDSADAVSDGWIPPVCGDGVVQSPEDCDDANAVNGDGCDTNCIETRCGNGVVTSGEKCDDGNQTNGDGCDADCSGSCGNGSRDALEACDDGNLTNGDGCDANCQATGCGNGIVTTGEQCDDGNTVSGDGCEAQCTWTACVACQPALVISGTIGLVAVSDAHVYATITHVEGNGADCSRTRTDVLQVPKSAGADATMITSVLADVSALGVDDTDTVYWLETSICSQKIMRAKNGVVESLVADTQQALLKITGLFVTSRGAGAAGILTYATQSSSSAELRQIDGTTRQDSLLYREVRTPIPEFHDLLVHGTNDVYYLATSTRGNSRYTEVRRGARVLESLGPDPQSPGHAVGLSEDSAVFQVPSIQGALHLYPFDGNPMHTVTLPKVGLDPIVPGVLGAGTLYAWGINGLSAGVHKTPVTGGAAAPVYVPMSRASAAASPSFGTWALDGTMVYFPELRDLTDSAPSGLWRVSR